MVDERFNSDYTYDGRFDVNMMVVGRTGCGKTTFIQNLGKNKMFGRDINLVFWVSKIRLRGEREDVIRESFSEQTVKFVYPNNLDEFNYLIDFFTSEKMPESDGNLGEKIAIDKFIVMDDVSGLADRCEDFSNFLTVSRKYGYSCVYVFHTIYPRRQSWEMIMSQTHILNFFPGSAHSGRILKTLSLFTSRERETLTFPPTRFGSTGSIFRFLIRKKSYASPSTLETLTILDQENLELGRTMDKNNTVTLIVLILTHDSSVF